jgi:hypothetical protein
MNSKTKERKNVKRLIAIVISLALLSATPAYTQSMKISPNGSRPSAMRPTEYFTGAVIVDPLFDAKESMQSTGGHVTFAPGARSAWHTHPAGQILIVTSEKDGCRKKAARSARSSQAMQQFPESLEPQSSSRFLVWPFVNLHAIIRLKTHLIATF